MELVYEVSVSLITVVALVTFVSLITVVAPVTGIRKVYASTKLHLVQEHVSHALI